MFSLRDALEPFLCGSGTDCLYLFRTNPFGFGTLRRDKEDDDVDKEEDDDDKPPGRERGGIGTDSDAIGSGTLDVRGAVELVRRSDVLCVEECVIIFLSSVLKNGSNRVSNVSDGRENDGRVIIEGTYNDNDREDVSG